MWEDTIIDYNGEVLAADSKRDAIKKWIDMQDGRREISAVRVRDSYTFNEGSEFEETYYLVSGAHIGDNVGDSDSDEPLSVGFPQLDEEYTQVTDDRFEYTIPNDENIAPMDIIPQADLKGADLSDADLSGADLTDADLSDADLTDADLSGADLSDADLSDADLTRATLNDATVTEAQLKAARN